MYKLIVVIITINLIMMIRVGYKVYLVHKHNEITKRLRSMKLETREERIEYVKLYNKRFKLVHRCESKLLGWR